MVTDCYLFFTCIFYLFFSVFRGAFHVQANNAIYVWVMRYQSLEINYHTAPNNKSTALPILQKLISIMVCLLGRAEYLNQCYYHWHPLYYNFIEISKIWWQNWQINFLKTSAISQWISFENYLSKIQFKSPRDQCVKVICLVVDCIELIVLYILPACWSIGVLFAFFFLLLLEQVVGNMNHETSLQKRSFQLLHYQMHEYFFLHLFELCINVIWSHSIIVSFLSLHRWVLLDKKSHQLIR